MFAMNSKRIIIGVILVIAVLGLGAGGLFAYQQHTENVIKDKYYQQSINWSDLEESFSKTPQQTVPSFVKKAKIENGKLIFEDEKSSLSVNSPKRLQIESSELDVFSDFYLEGNKTLGEIEHDLQDAQVPNAAREKHLALQSKFAELNTDELKNPLANYRYLLALNQLKETAFQDYKIGENGAELARQAKESLSKLVPPTELEDYQRVYSQDLDKQIEYNLKIEAHDIHKKFAPDRYGAASKEELAHFRAGLDLITHFPDYKSGEYDLQSKFSSERKDQLLQLYKDIYQLIKDIRATE